MKELKIVNSTPVQEDFWGNGAVYHGYAGMQVCPIIQDEFILMNYVF